MAKIKCPECGHDVSTMASSCPNCGAPADSIRKAAAGLEGLVALGEVLHEHGGDENEGARLRYAKMKNEIDELYESWMHSYGDEQDMIWRMIQEREKRMKNMAIDLGLCGTNELSERDRQRLRRDIDRGKL